MAKKKKKNKLTASLIFFVVVMLSLTAGIIYYIGRPKFVHYADFGIDIPVNYDIHGIDVSRYQRGIDWEEVSAMHINRVAIGFCFIKSTEGSDDEDPRFDRNWKAAKSAGIPRGAYHFFNPFRSGRSQAKNYITTVKLESGDLPPVLDVEQAGTLSKEVLQQRVADWLDLVEQHYGVRPILYTGADFYARYFAGRFDQYPLWVAHYLVRDKPRVKRKWSFWQHNESGRVNGIEGTVDFNVFNGDSTDFQQLLIP